MESDEKFNSVAVSWQATLLLHHLALERKRGDRGFFCIQLVSASLKLIVLAFHWWLLYVCCGWEHPMSAAGHQNFCCSSVSH